jgi:hypothetical protein
MLFPCSGGLSTLCRLYLHMCFRLALITLFKSFETLFHDNFIKNQYLQQKEREMRIPRNRTWATCSKGKSSLPVPS